MELPTAPRRRAHDVHTYRVVEEIAAGLIVSRGVFRPDAGSMALAASVHDLRGSFLDMGTGSGLISIVLAMHGNDGVASDCSKAALQCARKNFRKFDLPIPTCRSDMFENIDRRFDYIIFNPPMQSRETESARRIKNGIKDVMPGWLVEGLSRIAQPALSVSRRAAIGRFVDEACGYLEPGGKIFIGVLCADLPWTRRLAARVGNFELHERTSKFCVLAIAPSGQGN